MRRSVWVPVGALGLLIVVGATAAVWFTEFRRPKVHIGHLDAALTRSFGEQAERRLRAEGDKNLDGEWERQSCVTGGKEWASPPGVRYLLVFKGGTLQFFAAFTETYERMVLDEWVVKTDAALTPKALDMAPSEDPTEGRAELGVYEINGDVLRICSSEWRRTLDHSWPRPTEFTGNEGSGLRLETYRRVKQ
jgi:uncharacterized protein (TIGR03067 family)